MSERIKNQYDSLYASSAIVFGEGKPVAAVRKLPDYISGGKVLDIGGGEGRNALYLAKLGFSVEVHDISSVGLEKLRVVVSEQNLNISTKVTDVVTDEIEGFYDVVINSYVLHHIDRTDAVRIIQNAQGHTNVNGVHVIETFANEGELYERNTNSERFYPSENELSRLYKDWDIKELSSKESTTQAKNKQGERLKNHIVTLIAVKKA